LRRVDEIELRPRRSTSFDHVLQSGSVFLEQSEQLVTPGAHLFETIRVQLHRASVTLYAARQLLQRIKPGVEQLLHASGRRVDALDCGQRALCSPELSDYARFVTGQQIVEAARQSAQLVSVLQYPGLILQLRIFAGRNARLFNFLRDVPQIIGALLRFSPPSGERRDLATHREELIVGVPHQRSLRFRPSEGVEYLALGIRVEQGLRVVLAVKIHELASNLRQNCRRHRSAVDPCPPPAVGCDLPFENERVVFHFNAALVRQLHDSLDVRHVEHAFDRSLLRAGPNEIRAGALAQEQSQGTDDD